MHVVENNRFMGHVVGGELVCRGHEGCRGCTSWNTRLSWRHVVGHNHVVDVCRGQQSFSAACRGDKESVSWNTSMSWVYVVEHMLFHVHVVGTDVVCRGY